MEELIELLFLLASADRLTLLYTISQERFRLTQLASKLSASTQETSRHLSRLQDARIIGKESDGRFMVTPLGRSLLVLIPSMGFLARHREYFLSHDISTLPAEFVERIGELDQSEFRQGIGETLRHTVEVVREAKEYVWLCSDNPMDLATLGHKGAGQNIPFKIIVPAGRIGANTPGTAGVELGDNTELRLVDKVEIGMAMNEKRAGIAFPGLTGEIDFNSGFGSANVSFHKWCADLFIFHWNKASP